MNSRNKFVYMVPSYSNKIEVSNYDWSNIIKSDIIKIYIKMN